MLIPQKMTFTPNLCSAPWVLYHLSVSGKHLQIRNVQASTKDHESRPESKAGMEIYGTNTVLLLLMEEILHRLIW